MWNISVPRVIMLYKRRRMGIFNKANAIELTQEDLQDAKSTAGIFVDEFVKRRAFANVLAARAALKLLFSLNIDATNLYSMYSINKVLEKLDIADIYAGNIRIDARLVNDANEIFIPKSHFTLGIVPDLYVIFRFDKSLSSVEFLGCVNPEEMDKSKENRDYYFVDEDILYNLKIFKNLVRNNNNPSSYVPSNDDIERAENLIVPLEDGDIFNADYEFLIKQLAYNVDLRKKVVEFENFEFVSRKVVTEETVYGDSVLGLIGSDKLYDRNEFTTDIDLNELSDETVDSFVDDFDESDYVVPQMDEFTGEISLDDALNQMNDVEDSDLDNSDDLQNGAEFSDESNSNAMNIDNFIDEMSDFSESDNDAELPTPKHKLSAEYDLDNQDSAFDEFGNDTGFQNNESMDFDNSDDMNFENEETTNFEALDDSGVNSDYNETLNDDVLDVSNFNTEYDGDIDFNNIESSNFENQVWEEDVVPLEDDETQSMTEDLVSLEEDDMPSAVEDLVPFGQDESQSGVDNLISLEEDEIQSEPEDLVQFEHDESQSELEDLVSLEEVGSNYSDSLNSFDDDLRSQGDSSAYINQSSGDNSILSMNNDDEENSVADLDMDDFSEYSDSQPDFSNDTDNFSGEMETLPELDIDEEDDEDLTFDPDAPINFDDDGSDIGGFDLPDLDGFSMEDAINELDTSDIGESFIESEDLGESLDNNLILDDIVDNSELNSDLNANANSPQYQQSVQVQSQIPMQSQVSAPQKEIKPFEDDEDIADLPVLKIVNENSDTYKKKMYNTTKIDDIDMENVNLDDFDDYETEDKEERVNESKELEDMMSDLDSLLNSENFSLEGVDDILTDEELNESLKKLEEEENLRKQQEEEALRAQQAQEDDAQSDYSDDTSSDDSAEENSDDLSPEHNDTESAGMSLDDFLNSSSFNDMSTNNEIGANIEDNQNLNDIYQDESILSQQSIADDNPEMLLTDEATMVDNSANLYDEQSTGTDAPKAKPKSRAPQLAVVLVVLMCACVYVNKDIIMDNFNISFPKKAEEPVPEFDLNSLREPQPAPGAEQEQEPAAEESPIPSIPQPTDMPDAPPAAPTEQASASPAPVAADASQPAPVAVPQNTSNKITKLSWEVPENLASNDKIRKYLQIAGRTLKLSLQNDLLVATELPFSNKIMLDLKIVPSGNIVSSDFIISSGSKQIDNIVLQSVKDTLKYVRPPLGEIQSPNSDFTLIINF